MSGINDRVASTPRRRFLGQVSRWALGGVVIGAARPAAAFQTMPASDYSALVDQACGVTANHARQLEQARARLGDVLTSQQLENTLQALRCPICGCPLTGNEDQAASEQGHGS